MEEKKEQLIQDKAAIQPSALDEARALRDEIRQMSEDYRAAVARMEQLRVNEVLAGRGEAGVTQAIDKEAEAKARINKMLESTGLQI